MATSIVTLTSPKLTPLNLSFSFKGTTKPLIKFKQSLSIKLSKSHLSIVAASSSSSSPIPTVTSPGPRFRLDNLGPQPGSRKKGKRKGRGIAAGQGNSCGFGMRGQKSRSGPGIMRGFEGGQMPLYRRLPKLKGIAGGMRRL